MKSGVCVGGPSAGQWLAFRNDFYEVAHVPRVLAMPYGNREMQGPLEVRKYTYRWMQFSPHFGCWALKELLDEKGVPGLIEELAAGYHPVATT